MKKPVVDYTGFRLRRSSAPMRNIISASFMKQEKASLKIIKTQ